MARFILRPKAQSTKQTERTLTISLTSQSTQRRGQEIDAEKLALRLRKPRSKAYCQAMQKLDAGGAHLSPQFIDEIQKIITEEFPDISIRGTLIGIVSRCYLGNPYEVHTLDMTGGILHHYQHGEALPEMMEKARGLALHGNYAFVEVYENACRAVSADGSVAVIQDETA